MPVARHLPAQTENSSPVVLNLLVSAPALCPRRGMQWNEKSLGFWPYLQHDAALALGSQPSLLLVGGPSLLPCPRHLQSLRQKACR